MLEVWCGRVQGVCRECAGLNGCCCGGKNGRNKVSGGRGKKEYFFVRFVLLGLWLQC